MQLINNKKVEWDEPTPTVLAVLSDIKRWGKHDFFHYNTKGEVTKCCLMGAITLIYPSKVQEIQARIMPTIAKKYPFFQDKTAAWFNDLGSYEQILEIVKEHNL